MSVFQSLFSRGEPSRENDEAALRRLDRLSIFLDSALRVPIFGTRIGADALLNFVPGAGLIVAKSLSAYIIWEAHRLGVPRSVLMRMVGNLAVDFGISIVPVAGWIGDAFYRANLRNVALLRSHLRQRAGTYRATSRKASKPIIIEGEWQRSPA